MLAKVISLVGIFVLPNLYAQETPARRFEMATNQLKRLAADMTARCLTDVRSLDDWKAQQLKLRRELQEMLGLYPFPKRTPLKAQITGRLERESYDIEKIIFESMPGLYVTGNFYVPKGVSGALPTILYLCGHSPHPLGAKFQYQDRAIWFASHGYACLILDTHEFGELSGVHHGTHDLNMWHWLSLGYTPAGVEVWNAIRALDYLETRPEVDAARFGLTGISGGGAMTWYTAALDERIRAAAPVCATFSWGSQADHWVARGQCDCIYYHNSYRWDFPIVAALIAPRPLLILSGRKDTIFPPDGYHEVFQRAKGIYDLYAGGQSDRIREVDDDVPHSDPPLFLREARQWMQRWVKGDDAEVPLETATPSKTTAEELACFAALPADAVNYKIQNEFVRAVSLTKPSRRAWKARKADLAAQLKDRVFGWFPSETVLFDTETGKGSGGWHVRYGYTDYKDCSFQTEQGIRVRAQLMSPKGDSSTAPLLIHLKRPVDSFYSSDADEVLPALGRYHVLVFNPRFSELVPSPADYTDIERTATWVGRTITAMQVWDTLRAIEWSLRENNISPSSISIYGKGEMGIVGLYAALFDNRITQVILNDAPGSHWQAAPLLNVLRTTDIAEVAGALAPRRVVSLTPFPQSFDFTRAVFRLEKARQHLVESPSLADALEIWKYPWREASALKTAASTSRAVSSK